MNHGDVPDAYFSWLTRKTQVDSKKAVLSKWRSADTLRFTAALPMAATLAGLQGRAVNGHQ